MRALPQVFDPRARAVLRVDSAAGAVAGMAVLLLLHWIAALYRFPVTLVAVLAVTNLAYAAYSGSLVMQVARGRRVRRWRVDLLIAGNLAWTVTCVVLAAALWRSASVFGVAHLLLEALFVGGLAAIEYRVVRPQTS